jgi:proteic killer suppression protein
VIRSFKDKDARALLSGQYVRRLPRDIQPRARRKLLMLDAAASLLFLAASPANRLEAFKGDRRGQYSIRINDQWQIFLSDGMDRFGTWKSSTITDGARSWQARQSA